MHFHNVQLNNRIIEFPHHHSLHDEKIPPQETGKFDDMQSSLCGSLQRRRIHSIVYGTNEFVHRPCPLLQRVHAVLRDATPVRHVLGALPGHLRAPALQGDTRGLYERVHERVSGDSVDNTVSAGSDTFDLVVRRERNMERKRTEDIHVYAVVHHMWNCPHGYYPVFHHHEKSEESNTPTNKENKTLATVDHWTNVCCSERIQSNQSPSGVLRYGVLHSPRS